MLVFVSAGMRLAQQPRHLSKRPLQCPREPAGGRPRRNPITLRQQRLHPDGGPACRLRDQGLEAALGDREGAGIGGAEPGALVEPGVGGAALRQAGDPLDQAQRLAQLRDLAGESAAARTALERLVG